MACIGGDDGNQVDSSEKGEYVERALGRPGEDSRKDERRNGARERRDSGGRGEREDEPWPNICTRFVGPYLMHHWHTCIAALRHFCPSATTSAVLAHTRWFPNLSLLPERPLHPLAPATASTAPSKTTKKTSKAATPADGEKKKRKKTCIETYS